MNNFSLDIGPAIRRYRKAAHLTQEKLAEKSGLSVKFISMLESNEQSNVSIQNLARIAHALGLDLATLISQMEATHPGLPVYSQQLMATLERLPVDYANRLSKGFLDTVRTFTDFQQDQVGEDHPQ